MVVPLPKQDEHQNTETTGQSDIGGRKPRSIGNKAETWLTNYGKHSVHQ